MTSSSEAPMAEVWDRAQLLGDSNQGNDPMLWGVPGHLTAEQVDIFFKLKAQVQVRDSEFRDTLYCFGVEEGEAFAICRWLRARKYVYNDVIAMIEEATKVRASAKQQGFYPDPVAALGCDPSLFYAQYPQLYSGFAKNGVPLFISKPGILNVDGMECITTLDGILKFHWYIMMHDFANRLRSQKQKDPERFKRFECVIVLDLDKLTLSQLSKRALAIIKEQAAIDSVCFPETMCKMFIVNAPSFFAATWRLIKGWLDPRTASKIEVISSRKTMEKRLKEVIDENQLPSDYGGTGPDTNVTINEMFTGEADRVSTKMLYLRGHGSEVFDLVKGESCEISIFTRSTDGAKFSLTNADSKEIFVEGVQIKHLGTDDVTELPTSGMVSKARIPGPLKLKVKADSNAGRFSTHNYLIVCTIYK